MKIKKGVDPSLHPAVLWAVGIATMVFNKYGLPGVVTSGRDGTHKPSSRHYKGLAADMRTNHPKSTPTLIKTIYREIEDLLDRKGFDIVLESDHLHLEYDPKGEENWIEVI